MTSRALRIGIDARELLGRPTGVGRYLAELLARWTRDRALAAHHLVLYAPAPVELAWLGDTGATAEARVVPGSGGTGWEQGALASAAAEDALALFFAPAYSAPLRLRVPTAVAMHDVSFAAQPQWFRWREGLRRRWLARLSAGRAAAVLTLTEWSRGQIVDHLGIASSKVHVVAPAVDTHPALAPVGYDAPPAAGASGERLVLYVGSIFNRRHVPALLRAFPLVVRDVPTARLAVVGENRSHPREDLPALIDHLELGSHVALHDYVDAPTLAGLYARACAFVFLSEYEGFGLTPLEAMARGVPALLLDTEVARESCGDAADYVASPEDRRGIAASIVRLLREDAYRAARARDGRARAARFSWDRTAARTFEILKSCAG